MRASALTAFALAATALAAGCSWTIDRDGGWLPLVGDPPVLADWPRLPTGRTLTGYYQASDGRVWIKTRDEIVPPDHEGALVMRSFELVPEEHRFPSQAYLAEEGVVVTDVIASSDPTVSHLRLTLDRLGAGPTVTRDVSLPAAMWPYYVVRGPDCFVVARTGAKEPGSDGNEPRIWIVSDDGSEDSIAAGPEDWDVQSNPEPVHGTVESVFQGSARFILLHGDGGNSLGAYDVTTRTLLRLGALPSPVPMEQPDVHFQPPPSYVYDDLQERVWLCGVETATVSLLTGESRTLPFGCIDLRYQRGAAELLVQAPDGAVYALLADGSAVTPLGTFPPYGIRSASGRAFLYVRSPRDEVGDTLSGWVGDTHVVRAGMSPRFSADGQRLYWLEDVALHVGDLWSFDVATRAAHHLVRNVPQFDELPDGRLVAIANAALDGPFNRAVVVDERAGESRWLAAGVQRLQRVGDAVIVERSGLTRESYRVPVPPRTTP